MAWVACISCKFNRPDLVLTFLGTLCYCFLHWLAIYSLHLSYFVGQEAICGCLIPGERTQPFTELFLCQDMQTPYRPTGNTNTTSVWWQLTNFEFRKCKAHNHLCFDNLKPAKTHSEVWDPSKKLPVRHVLWKVGTYIPMAVLPTRRRQQHCPCSMVNWLIHSLLPLNMWTLFFPASVKDSENRFSPLCSLMQGLTWV